MNAQILNKYIELIDKGYCDDCNELNCLGNFPHKDIAKNIKDILEENQELKNQQKEYIEQLEKLAYQNMVPSDFANGCKVAYGIALNRYKEIIGDKYE